MALQGFRQPVPQGKHTHNHDGVGSIEVSGKAELVKPSHVAGCQLPRGIASSGGACAEQVEMRNVRQDAGDKESHGYHTQGETQEPHQHKPVPMQARFCLASWLETFGSVSRCRETIYSCPPCAPLETPSEALKRNKHATTLRRGFRLL